MSEQYAKAGLAPVEGKQQMASSVRGVMKQVRKIAKLFEALGRARGAKGTPRNIEALERAAQAQASLEEYLKVLFELASVLPSRQAEQAEWQARPRTGQSEREDGWRKVVPSKQETTVLERVAYLRTLKRADGSPAYEFRALYLEAAEQQGAPAALANETASGPSSICDLVADAHALEIRLGPQQVVLNFSTEAAAQRAFKLLEKHCRKEAS